MTTAATIAIRTDVPIPTWFGVGGGAARFAAPADADQLRVCLAVDPELRVLGEGANLLVDDEGVDELVVSLGERFSRVRIDAAYGVVRAQAGVDLRRLITQTVSQGLGGLEGLGGIPATLGGAVMMNAGGAFGEIASAVSRVFALDRAGRDVVLDRRDIRFAYRRSGLEGLIITEVELALSPGNPAPLRERLREVMARKSASQPLRENSAGCCFKNPTLAHDLRDEAGFIGGAGERVGAGLLIDRAGLKGSRVGSAEVSERHANFITASRGGRARDVIDLMDLVAHRVREAFGVTLEREVVVWRREKP